MTQSKEEYCVECNRDLSEIDVADLHEKYHILADRISFIKMDLNRITSNYLDIMLKYKEDHKIMREYLKQDRKFQQWSAKMALSSATRK